MKTYNKESISYENSHQGKYHDVAIAEGFSQSEKCPKYKDVAQNARNSVQCLDDVGHIHFWRSGPKGLRTESEWSQVLDIFDIETLTHFLQLFPTVLLL